MERLERLERLDLIIAKPKKVDGTFICTIKNSLKLELPSCHLIHIKETNDQAQFIFLKNKNLCNYMYDINNQIISIVKENCSSWFNTNMNPDLIDDYYTNTLVYDKTHGELIKIKIIGDLLPEDMIGNIYNFELNAIHLRFFKQKFVLETKITKHDIISECDIIDFPSDNEDDEIDEEDNIIYPSNSELLEMKQEVINKTHAKIDQLQQELNELTDIKKKMEEAQEIDDIIKLYNQFQ
jgi:hypothetical protein